MRQHDGNLTKLLRNQTQRAGNTYHAMLSGDLVPPVQNPLKQYRLIIGFSATIGISQLLDPTSPA